MMKQLLQEAPPLIARGGTGLLGGVGLLASAALYGRGGRLIEPAKTSVLALLNVSSWLALMGLSLLWLTAAEAVVVAYSMPIWAAVLAWPILGERPSVTRIVALGLALVGMAALSGIASVDPRWEKLPGLCLALAGSLAFAVGTVITKKSPPRMSSLESAGWQLVIGCLPVVAAGLIFEQPDVRHFSARSWAYLAYYATVGFGLSYLTWFTALRRLPASVAAIGTLLVPVVGVSSSALLFGERLTTEQIIALSATLVGIVLATRT